MNHTAPLGSSHKLKRLRFSLKEHTVSLIWKTLAVKKINNNTAIGYNAIDSSKKKKKQDKTQNPENEMNIYLLGMFHSLADTLYGISRAMGGKRCAKLKQMSSPPLHSPGCHEPHVCSQHYCNTARSKTVLMSSKCTKRTQLLEYVFGVLDLVC